MSRQAQIKLSEKPDDWSAEAIDFINKVTKLTLSNSAYKENHQDD